MQNEMKQPRNRRSIRLPEFDYSQPGAYFVTICVMDKLNRMGQVMNGQMIPNQVGKIADDAWRWLGLTFPAITIPIYCIMPNHIHAIVSIDYLRRGALQSAQGGLQAAPTRGVMRSKSLGRIIGAYKTHSTILINKLENTQGAQFWQRNFYERVIRNEREMEAIYGYIDTNPANWDQDEYR